MSLNEVELRRFIPVYTFALSICCHEIKVKPLNIIDSKQNKFFFHFK